ncbi:hypothetical protein ABZ322_37690, partial [Streptomyces sp. NPDC006129]
QRHQVPDGEADHPGQRHRLMQLLAARRNAAALRDVDVASPWVDQPLPEPYPSTPLGVTGAELRRMDPVDAVLRVRAAHPDHTPAELASLCTEYGVTVSEAQVRVALHALPKERTRPVPAAPAGRPLAAVPDLAAPPVPDRIEHAYQPGGLQLDVATEPEVRREFASAVPAELADPRPTRTEVHARVPGAPTGLEHPIDFIRRRAAEGREAVPHPAPTRPEVAADPEAVPEPGGLLDPPGTGEADEFTALLARARQVDADHRRTHGRPASIQTLKASLRIGQSKAQLIREALSTPRKAG